VTSIPTALRTCATLGLAAALSVGVSACGSASSGGSTTSPAATTTAADPIMITQAWARTTEGAMDTTMVPFYITLKNGTSKELSITSGTSAVASRVEFHEMVMQNGKMVMQPKAGGFKIAPGATMTLKPGGDHIMLMGLKQPLAVGSEVTVTLTFSDGTTKTVTAPVKKFADGNSQYAGTGTASMSPSMSMAPSASMSGTMTP
jgi:periplasmic copper chaperone A